MDDLDVRSSPGSDSASSCSWWSDSNDGRLRRSYAPSPEHPTGNRADAQLLPGFSGEARRIMNVRSNITLYQQLAHENPYSQAASFPDAHKSPLCPTSDTRSVRSSVLSSMQAAQGSNSEGSMLKDSAGDWEDDDCQSKMSF
ncbi:hypothetical protein N7539_002317 [Penicillium diatomitis]|uniref:Uncharacterized protein n=1 Tax=Penicillium diatomitis TaxID=2819901 RepID=A0A9X0BYI6_9EURO|nr:uncharacterized protein N7539_002317 [Penicillium diatomitis]KAJ5490750.1 hypothetical protein N7539_002317 [Penicillium diatomitis]